MGIETALPDRKGKVYCELPKETNSRSKRSRRRPRKVSPVQKLFDTCKEVFSSCGAGIVPPPRDIEKLASVLNTMRLADVGLNPGMPYFRTDFQDEVPKITYMHVYECDKFSIGIFCLPPSGVIPLHNHPGMTVFSKLLFGSMHIKSYDWEDDFSINPAPNGNPSQVQHPGVRLAKVKVDADFTAPCNSSILYPAAGGNMHRFTALTACAVLDVLGPPYSYPEDRDCTYYFDFPIANFSADGVSVPEEEREGYAWLQERDKLEDFAVDGAAYNGPKIV